MTSCVGFHTYWIFWKPETVRIFFRLTFRIFGQNMDTWRPVYPCRTFFTTWSWNLNKMITFCQWKDVSKIKQELKIVNNCLSCKRLVERFVLILNWWASCLDVILVLAEILFGSQCLCGYCIICGKAKKMLKITDKECRCIHILKFTTMTSNSFSLKSFGIIQ